MYLTIKPGSVLRFGKEGVANGVAFKCILAKVTLYYPKEDEDEEEKIKDNQKKRVEDYHEDNQEMIEDSQNNKNPPDTADLYGIVAFLEQTPNRSPRSSLMLKRFERALDNKELFDLTDKEAVALEPNILKFPDSDTPS